MERSWQTLHTLGGPAVFLLLALGPFPSVPHPVRASIGLLVWMSWWWIRRPVHLAVTGFLPLVVLAVFDFLPVGTILSAYAEPLIFLLLGANILATLWRRWGLDRRIALVALLGIGTGTRQQILAWFLVAMVMSAFLPNAVVAASLMPIVVAMLRFVGIEDVGRSAFGSALLIAVAWGTSVGGSGTPMGGAPNLLTIQFLEQQLVDHEFLFTTWLRNVLPLTIVIAVASLIFMRFAFKPEMERVDGSRAYFAQELRALAGMSVPERWGLALFATATMLAFTRQLYAPALPGLTPPFAFLAFAVLSFAIRHNGVPLLEWEFAQTHMVWGLIYLFAGGSALGQILSETGTARFLADRLVPLAGGGGFLAVVVFASYGLALPSASAGPAIAAGYGVSVKTMFSWGVWLAGLITVLLIGAGYLLGRFWPGFGVA